ncbi:transcriptional regulator, AraC family with amidase-like domain [Aliiroseovarius crassostreae]|uniref:AraC family transcriptional regulator n=2 Tax=Aliiroseovarius crassostreae TaxID=154981 RepID=A0A0P7KGM3_9RHOB|nr:helix-turn-helix domain-containing protein [Aliiroseovarius crassostreae]KPN62477.1 AraC family transcriptional regulator [Aliiroseovarius crassostreae]SFU82478.1 transcriptional regulator, AraC family with amidase-like domain [Aliiroseovarius crassostreae]
MTKANEQIDVIHLGILVFPGFPMACLTSCIEPLRAANEISGKDVFQWRVVAEQNAPVTSSAAVAFAPDTTLSEVTGLDYLFFVSSPDGCFENPSRAGAALQRHMRSGGILGAFSGGVFPLTRTGLTRGDPMSVHWCYSAAFQAEFPDVPIETTVICDAPSIKSVSGASAVFDYMLNLIEARLGGDIMAEVACWFQHPLIRSATVSQKTPAIQSERSEDMLPKPVARAIQLFSEHIDSPLQISEVAQTLGVSTRSLERSFKDATGQSPLKYYRAVRMKQARQLVLYTNEPVTDIAYMVGYSTPVTFLRHYRESHGITPISDRRKRNSLRVSEGDCLPSG